MCHNNNRYYFFVVVMSAIFIIALVSLLVMTAYGEDEKCEVNDRNIDILCYVINIYEQNNTIIEKLDWNNCALSHKKAFGYSFEEKWITSSSDRSHNYKQLVEDCGEIP